MFFAYRQRGDQNFLGDQKKMATADHKQMAPLPVKNDSSLISVWKQNFGHFLVILI